MLHEAGSILFLGGDAHRVHGCLFLVSAFIGVERFQDERPLCNLLAALRANAPHGAPRYAINFHLIIVLESWAEAREVDPDARFPARSRRRGIGDVKLILRHRLFSKTSGHIFFTLSRNDTSVVPHASAILFCLMSHFSRRAAAKIAAARSTSGR